MVAFAPQVTRRRLLTASIVGFVASACSREQPANRPFPAQDSTSPHQLPGDDESTFYVINFGAKADGISDDRPAMQAALDAAGKRGGGTIIVPNTPVAISFGEGLASLGIPAGVSVRGEGPASALLVSSSAEFASVFTTQGDNIAIRDLRITRASPFDGGAVDVRAGQDITLERLLVDGSTTGLGGTFHALLLQGSRTDVIEGFQVLSCTFIDCAYGLLQPSPQRVSVKNVFVSGSRFSGNHASDLEFNAPEASNTDVMVFNCDFQANAAPGPEAGWGIGLANVQQARIIGNRFDGYAMSAIHVEDRSALVQITDNSFVRVGQTLNDFASAIIVLSGSTDILVSRNDIDLSQQQDRASAVWIGHGGGTEPSAITVTDNLLILKDGDRSVNIQGARRVTERRNVRR